MFPIILRTIEVAAVLATFGGFAYTVLSLWSAAHLLWTRKSCAPVELPSVSILKPLKGMDPEMMECLRSHCRQDCDGYEVVFGVSDKNDPAIGAVQQLKAEFPARVIKLVVAEKPLGANTKVSTLAQMLPEAAHEYLVVNDSDIRVPQNYIQRVIAPLANPDVRMVTCLYRGVPQTTLGSWTEALGILDFAGGVVAARWLERGIHFGLGSTLAFRRTDLDEIGGFEGFADYLADDYQLGRLLSDRGRVELSHLVVETLLPAYTIREFLAHQLRWARTIRDSRPGGYVGLGFTHYLVWAILALLSSGGEVWAWFLTGAALTIRVAAVMGIGKGVLNDQRTQRYLIFIPMRDLLAAFIWVVGFWGHRVSWRGEVFLLRKGRLERVNPR
jgi:ceramide glucosyltransferase